MPPVLSSYESRQHRRRAARRERAVPLMSTIEQESMAKQLGGGLLSTLEVAGRVLDIPGGFVRNRLADVTGVETPQEGNIHGRDLLESWGVVGPNVDQGLIPDAGDVAGFALEVLTDPLTFLTLGAGAATKAGKVAKAAGTFPRKTLIDPKTGAVIMGKREARRMTPRQIMERTLDVHSPEARAFKKKFARAAEGKGYGLAERLRMFEEEAIGGSFGFFGKTMNVPGAAGRAKFFDKLGAAARFSTPGRGLAGLFSPPAIGMTTKTGQAVIGPETFTKYKQIRAERALEKTDLEEVLRGGGWDLGNPEHITKYEEGIRLGAEGLPIPLQATPEMTRAIQAVVAHMKPEFTEMVARAEKDGTAASELMDIITDASKPMNDPGYELQQIGYTARGPLVKRGQKQKPDKYRPDTPKLQKRRDPHFFERRELRGFPQGTRGIITAISDSRLTSGSELKLGDRTKILGKEYMNWLPQEEVARRRFNKMSPADIAGLDDIQLSIRENLDTKWDNIGKMASWFHRHETDANPFDKPILESFMERQIIADQVHASTENAKKLFAMTSVIGGDDFGRPLADALGEVKISGKNGMPSAIRAIARWGDQESKDAVAELLERLEINVNLADLEGVEKGIADAFDSARLNDANVLAAKEKVAGLRAISKETGGKFKIQDAIDGGLITEEEALLSQYKGSFEDSIKDSLRHFRVADDVLEDATRLRSYWESPEELGMFIQAYDSFTNAFKAGVTTMFPGFHVRNFYSEFWNNIIADGYDPRYAKFNPHRYVQPFLDARTIVRGKPIKDISKLPIFRGLTDEQATRRLAAAATAWESVGTGRITEVIGDVPGLAQAAKIPGRERRTLASSIKGGWQSGGRAPVWWQRHVRGTLEEDLIEQRIVGAGRGVGEEVETVSRLATVIAKLRQGFSFESAADVSKFAHVDYSDLTSFERNVMKRVMPFFTWHRAQIPYQVRKFMEKPGGPVRQAIRFAAGLQTDEYVPEWAGTGGAIKVGENLETGDKTYLSGVDLPHEGMLEMLSLGPTLDRGAIKTGMSIASLLHPAIKGPIEYFTDTSMFRKGKKLSELDPPLGRTISNLASTIGYDVDPKFIRSSVPFGRAIEHAAMATPLSRFITTARKATDPRKTWKEFGWNLFTGVRTTTVGEKAKHRALINLGEEVIEGQQGVAVFRKLYLRDKDQILPGDFEVLRFLETLRDNARRKRAKEKKKQ